MVDLDLPINILPTRNWVQPKVKARSQSVNCDGCLGNHGPIHLCFHFQVAHLELHLKSVWSDNVIVTDRNDGQTYKSKSQFEITWNNPLKTCPDVRCLLTSAVVVLSVGQAVDLGAGVSGPWHSEQQWVRLDHVRVAGFKLTAGNQQGGEGARLGLDSSTGVRVQGHLLLPCRNLPHRTAHVLDTRGDNTHQVLSLTPGSYRKHDQHPHLPLLVTHFDQQHLQRDRVLLVLTVLRRLPWGHKHMGLPVSHTESVVQTQAWYRRTNLPALWKKPVKVSCRLEAKLWGKHKNFKQMMICLINYPPGMKFTWSVCFCQDVALVEN